MTSLKTFNNTLPGYNLRALRRFYGISQPKLSSAMSDEGTPVSVNKIRDIEKGDLSVVKLSEIDAICYFFNADPIRFLNEKLILKKTLYKL